MRTFSFFLLPILVCLFAASCRDNAANSTQVSAPNRNTTAVNNTNAAPVSSPTNTNAPIPVYTYEIVKTYRHDDDAFTQGLVFHNGFLYEGTGQESDLRKVELETGKVKEKRELDEKYFGEGITVLNGKIYQLTWQNGVCFVYDLNTFEPISLLAYNGEGWGLTNDGANLIMSDGSDKIYFRDPANFRTNRTLSVKHNGKPLYFINELEYVNGEIWANIWHSEETTTKDSLGNDVPNLGKPNHIARINPADGNVVGWIDLAGISPEDVNRDRENTLNGIAYDAATERIFVTGKQWRKLFEIKLKPKS
jgi:glutaminyl-peptide cyclotransferase